MGPASSPLHSRQRNRSAANWVKPEGGRDRVRAYPELDTSNPVAPETSASSSCLKRTHAGFDICRLGSTTGQDHHSKKSSLRSFSPVSQKPMAERPCWQLICAAAKCVVRFA